MSLKKSAKPAAPHATFTSQGWTWRVLKTYQSPKGEQTNQYARWLCFVTSPLCPEGEYGDTYIRDVIRPFNGVQSRLVQATAEFATAYEALKETTCAA
jgi:hypothetical protein